MLKSMIVPDTFSTKCSAAITTYEMALNWLKVIQVMNTEHFSQKF